MKLFKKMSFAVLAISVACVAVPAIAENVQTVSVIGQYGIGAVHDSSDIAMAPLPGGVQNLNYAGNPSFFEGAQLCISGRDGNWSVKKNGMIETNPRVPERRPVCVPIVNGQASVQSPFGRESDAFIERNGAIIAWAADNTLTPYHN